MMIVSDGVDGRGPKREVEGTTVDDDDESYVMGSSSSVDGGDGCRAGGGGDGCIEVYTAAAPQHLDRGKIRNWIQDDDVFAPQVEVA